MAERGDACPLNASQYANPTSLWSVPRLGARAAELRDRVIVLGRLRRDTWRGGDAVEMRVEELLEG